MVCPNALRITSRYTGARRWALRASTVTSLGCCAASSLGDALGIGAHLLLRRAAAQRHEHVQSAAARCLDERLEAVVLQTVAQQDGRARG